MRVWDMHMLWTKEGPSFDDKNMKFVCIYYDKRSKTYKLHNPVEKKIISSKDVYINEQSG
jgi:hypothetical protein